MVEAIISLLIYAAVLAIIIYIIIYALGVIGVPMPGKVVQLIWLIFGLLVLLWAFRALGGLHLPGMN
jgi:hypothetical protein